MFNVLRQQTGSRLGKLPLHIALRHSSTGAAFVPPAAQEDIVYRSPPTKDKPASPAFYTGRSSYYDQVDSLEACIGTTRQVLKDLHLYPLPDFARASIPPARPYWKDQTSLVRDIDVKLNPGRYRRIVTLLNQLDEYRRIADVAGCTDLAENIAQLLSEYEKHNKEALMASGKRKPVQFDEYGRTYTTGKRKESSARVWVIPVQQQQEPTAAAPKQKQDARVSLIASLPGQQPLSSPSSSTQVTTSNILINNVPLAEYFTVGADRERVIRPLQLAGVLGAFNVFALVRGGGTSGQAGAVSLGLARGLAAHLPDVESILRKAKVLKRDPRTVERKKTGLRKARAARTWVKR